MSIKSYILAMVSLIKLTCVDIDIVIGVVVQSKVNP